MESGDHGSMRKLKSAGLKFVSRKKLRSIRNRFNRYDHQSSMEKSSWKMAIQSDIDAALALVQLANDDPGLLHNTFCSHGMKHNVKGISSIKDLREKSEGDSHSKVAGSMVNLVVTREKTAFEGVMKDDDARVLDFPMSAMPYSAGRKKKKKRMFKKLSSLQPKCMKDNVSEKDDNLYGGQLLDSHELTNLWGNSLQKPSEVFLEDCHDRLGMLTIKKRKRVARSYLKRETVEVASPVKIPLKMRDFKLPVPAVQTRLSFSVIHLLSAVRRAMVAPHAKDDAVVYGNDQRESISEEIYEFYSLKDKSIGDSVLTNSKNSPSLTLNDIVERVRSTPMDPNILQTQEPLHDLVRQVLEIFSSKTPPLGAKGWMPLAVYHKSSKCWSWTGPITVNSCNADEEDVSAEAWSLPHDMLVKLVDFFAVWFKSFQERLRQVESLSVPPLVLMQPTLDGRERFRDISWQNRTISPSSEEVRAYFRKEEALRYLVPYRAFSYTALDGRKSAVAPLRKSSSKSSYRRQSHFMLKANRPPHVTVCCLVRDAAARLPGSIGTRADICTLTRDSQYIVEEVSDEKLGHVVSDALDRLHYEYDPCVKFDRDRKLWVYLHGKRGEEDFGDDGTLFSLTKRRQEMLLSNLYVHDTALRNGQEETSMVTASSKEVRAYFHEEERSRYLVPDRAFSYTAVDGRKSAVAPLRKWSSNPSFRHQNRSMLKANRPPHVSVLCLVRDAAARLPGSIGTRADISTLLRDSQFIVEEASDEQLGQVVRAVLERLHYEYDPCVKFDRHRKLWVYLHGKRGQEDFRG